MTMRRRRRRKLGTQASKVDSVLDKKFHQPSWLWPPCEGDPSPAWSGSGGGREGWPPGIGAGVDAEAGGLLPGVGGVEGVQEGVEDCNLKPGVLLFQVKSQGQGGVKDGGRAEEAGDVGSHGV